jgi:hypothetical protein
MESHTSIASTLPYIFPHVIPASVVWLDKYEIFSILRNIARVLYIWFLNVLCLSHAYYNVTQHIQLFSYLLVFIAFLS